MTLCFSHTCEDKTKKELKVNYFADGIISKTQVLSATCLPSQLGGANGMWFDIVYVERLLFVIRSFKLSLILNKRNHGASAKR